MYCFCRLPACPTGPHPPLRLARRPNRGHIGGVGPLLRYMPIYDVFIASGFSTSTLVNREVMHPTHYLLTKSGTRVRKTQFGYCMCLPRTKLVVYASPKLKPSYTKHCCAPSNERAGPRSTPIKEIHLQIITPVFCCVGVLANRTQGQKRKKKSSVWSN